MAESSTITGRDAAEALRLAGHTVAECRATSDPGLECAALREGGECPLERAPVDLYLLVRSNGGGAVSAERGVLCAAAHRVPIILSGVVDDNPYSRWTAAERSGMDVVALVEEVAARPLPVHSRIAIEAVAAFLDSSAESCSGEVRRVAGGLQAVVGAHPTPAPQMRAAAVNKVHQKLRAFDPWARYVDVSFSS